MTQRKDQPRRSIGSGDQQDKFEVRDVVASYDVGARVLANEYESLSFEEVHAPVAHL